jgi:hypothetical protein
MTNQAEPPNPEESTSEAESKARAWHEWMGIFVGLTGLLSILAIILSIVALSSSNPTSSSQTATATPAGHTSPAAGAPAVKPQSVKLLVKADDEHGRMGPDGKRHHPGRRFTELTARDDVYLHRPKQGW